MLSSISSSVLAISVLAASSLAASVPAKRDQICSSLLQPLIKVNGTELSTTETTTVQLKDVMSAEFIQGHGASCNGKISLGLAATEEAPSSIFSEDWVSSLKINNEILSVDLVPDFNTPCGKYNAFLFQYDNTGSVIHTFETAPLFVDGYYGRPNCTTALA